MQRRDFLKLAGLASLTFLAPPVLASPKTRAGASAQRTLILIQLGGGNDGLNTVVPYADPAYYDLRPNLALSRDAVHKLDERLGLHPALEGLMPSWESRELAVVRGVGYPDPNRSHFRSIEIWETGSSSDQYSSEGWLTSALPKLSPRHEVADGITLGRGDDGPLSGGKLRAVTMRDPERFIQAARRVKLRSNARAPRGNPALAHLLTVQRDLASAADSMEALLERAPRLRTSFPKHAFGRAAETTARLMVAGVQVPVIKLMHKGFDTHARQLGAHQRMIAQLGEGIAALRKALKEAGLWESTLIMTYSEFGRRPAENGSQGTDHGTAAPHLLLGGRVKGGLYGKQPSLTDLVNKDLKHHVDFRSLYTTVSQDWWGLSRGDIATRAHKALPCLRA